MTVQVPAPSGAATVAAMRLVPLLRANDAFHGRIVAARLAADGIITQVKGDDALYPGGQVEILVSENDLSVARELLLADEVEAAFLDGADSPAASSLGWRPWVIGLVLGGLVLFTWIQTVGHLH
jgi:hypothetical protein